MTDEDRIAELERENALLQHELTGVKNTLEAVGREKDDLARDAEACSKHHRTLEYIASELGFTADEISHYQPSQMLVGGIASRAAFLLQCTARWEHAKADFLVASEVDAIEARIDAGISAREGAV